MDASPSPAPIRGGGGGQRGVSIPGPLSHTVEFDPFGADFERQANPGRLGMLVDIGKEPPAPPDRKVP